MLFRQYRTEIEGELEEICNDILDLLDKTLLAADEISDEAQVFYYKMKGDYLRYLAEVQTASSGGDAAPKAKTAYEQAWSAAKPLKATNPIKLGLALNFSVFHYEILARQDSACTLAKEVYAIHWPNLKHIPKNIRNLAFRYFSDYCLHKNRMHLQAFDAAVTELDSLGGSEYKDATLIMQLLRDNLTLWQAEGGAEEDPAQVDEDGTAVEDM